MHANFPAIEETEGLEEWLSTRWLMSQDKASQIKMEKIRKQVRKKIQGDKRQSKPVPRG